MKKIIAIVFVNLILFLIGFITLDVLANIREKRIHSDPVDISDILKERIIGYRNSSFMLDENRVYTEYINIVLPEDVKKWENNDRADGYVHFSFDYPISPDDKITIYNPSDEEEVTIYLSDIEHHHYLIKYLSYHIYLLSF